MATRQTRRRCRPIRPLIGSPRRGPIGSCDATRSARRSHEEEKRMIEIIG